MLSIVGIAFINHAPWRDEEGSLIVSSEIIGIQYVSTILSQIIAQIIPGCIITNDRLFF